MTALIGARDDLPHRSAKRVTLGNGRRAPHRAVGALAPHRLEPLGHIHVHRRDRGEEHQAEQKSSRHLGLLRSTRCPFGVTHTPMNEHIPVKSLERTNHPVESSVLRTGIGAEAESSLS